MEAPTKPGGTRTTRPSRDLIGRFTTFSPIEFLKRCNPLRRRRRLKLGFDQPPLELKQLALPLRPAPPTLPARLIKSLAVKTGLLVGRALNLSRSVAAYPLGLAGQTLAKLQPVLAAAAKVQRAAFSRVARLRHSRTVCWCERKLQAVVAILQPAPWAANQTVLLMRRTRRLRAALFGMAALQWIGLAALVGTVAVPALGGSSSTNVWAHACVLVLCVSGLVGLAFQGWYHRLTVSWRDMELFICDRCGELRNFSPSNPCHECSTVRPPVFPGQIPDEWNRHQALINSLCTAGPALLASMFLLGARL